LALKEGKEDPMDIAIRRQVMAGSESVLTMPMVHGVDYDWKTVTTTYPKGADGRDVSAKEFVESAKKHAGQLAVFLARRNAAKRAAKEAKRSGKVQSSSKATGSAV
jgi:hypothetical protein